ncbi:MAG: TatD family hydrolase [Nitrososphaera sp.]
MLYDAHVHLTDAEYNDYIGDIITSLRAMKMVACSVTVDTATTLRSFDLFDYCSDAVRQFVGIHPEHAASDDLDRFLEIYQQNKGSVAGIGEIGLDGTYESERDVSYEKQKQIFAAMLALAESEGKPVSIHSRRALDDVLAILPSYKIKNVLLHWFAGSKKQLAKSMDMGLYVSYGPALVYADDKKALLKNTMKDRFLVETDGPVRYSHCFENRPALPCSFLASVVATAAATLGLPYDEAAIILQQNTEAFLG